MFEIWVAAALQTRTVAITKTNQLMIYSMCHLRCPDDRTV